MSLFYLISSLLPGADDMFRRFRERRRSCSWCEGHGTKSGCPSCGFFTIGYAPGWEERR